MPEGLRWIALDASQVLLGLGALFAGGGSILSGIAALRGAREKGRAEAAEQALEDVRTRWTHLDDPTE